MMVVYVGRNELAKHSSFPNQPDSGVRIAPREQQHPETPLLRRQEQEQLAIWNATQYDYARDVCVPQLVAKQAYAMPDTIAVVDADRVLSYRELNRRANLLAHYLRELGVRAVDTVEAVERAPEPVDRGQIGVLRVAAVQRRTHL